MKWQSLVTRLFHVTFDQVYPLVNPVVCHSSPEGYLPPDESDDVTVDVTDDVTDDATDDVTDTSKGIWYSFSPHCTHEFNW